MIVLGLTGSIAAGKTTVAAIFRELGIPVFDADAEVHRLYEKGGPAVRPIENVFPLAITNGRVDRAKLAEILVGNPAAMARLESIVHPLVRKSEVEFLGRCRAANSPLAVLDIPLLFETGRTGDVDKILVVSAPDNVRRQRAIARPGMSDEKFDMIERRQMPDSRKRQRADFIVQGHGGLESARHQIKAIVDSLTAATGQKA